MRVFLVEYHQTLLFSIFASTIIIALFTIIIALLDISSVSGNISQPVECLINYLVHVGRADLPNSQPICYIAFLNLPDYSNLYLWFAFDFLNFRPNCFGVNNVELLRVPTSYCLFCLLCKYSIAGSLYLTRQVTRASHDV